MNPINIIVPIICIIGSLYFIRKKKTAANCLLGFTVISVYSEPLFLSLSYSRIIYPVIFLTVLLPFIQDYKKINIHNIKVGFKKGKYKIFLVILIIIWVKIIFDSFFYGFEFFRTSQLKSSLYLVFCPTLMILISLLRDPTEKVCKDLLVGFCFYSVVLMLPLITNILTGHILSAALSVGIKLGVVEQDNINSGRFLFFGFIGILTTAFLYKNRTYLFFLLMLISFFFFVIMILNGTRQYLLGSMILILFIIYSTNIKKNLKLISVLCAVVVLLAINLDFFGSTNLAHKINRMQKERRLDFGRFEIWSKAFDEAGDHPFLGVGYRNFGAEEKIRLSGGTFQTIKDNAHGFFQEIMVEHGFLLAVPLFLIWLFMVLSIFIKQFNKMPQSKKLLFVLFFALSIPTNFSGGVYDSLGYHLFALTPFLLTEKHINKTSHSHNSPTIH